jgi:hypothetical protein
MHMSTTFYPTNTDAINQQLIANGFPQMQTDSNGRQYVTFSGGPNYQGTAGSPFLGSLEGNIDNRPSDLASNSANGTIGFVALPDGTSPDQYISSLIQSTVNYNGNQEDYSLVPSPPYTYNSNSYINGLMQANGGTMNVNTNWRYIGSNSPVPPADFQPP